MLHSSQYNNPSSSLNSEREKRGRGRGGDREKEGEVGGVDLFAWVC